MSFKSIQNKIRNNHADAETNSNDVDKLPRINLVSTTASFNNRQREIVLADKVLIEGSTVIYTQQFQDFDDHLLNFLTPYGHLETSEGFQQYTGWSFSNYNTWEKYTSGDSTITLLKMRVSGYLLTPNESGGWTSSIAPIYATAKIKVLNPNIRVEITNSKK